MSATYGRREIPACQIPFVAHGYVTPLDNYGMDTWRKRLDDHIEGGGPSRADIAEKLGRNVSAVGHWITGRNRINLDEFLALCTAAKADPRQILFGEMTLEVAQKTISDAVEEARRLRLVSQTPSDEFPPVRRFPTGMRNRAKRRKAAQK